MARQRVLAVGLGHMGMSHAPAYARLSGFELLGSASSASRRRSRSTTMVNRRSCSRTAQSAVRGRLSPMISGSAFFVNDVFGPMGSVGQLRKTFFIV